MFIGGISWQENIKILSEVLERLHKYNVLVSKCEFLKREVVYLGLKIDAEGLHPAGEKVDAVKRAPVPQNVTELRNVFRVVQCRHLFFTRFSNTWREVTNYIES